MKDAIVVDSKEIKKILAEHFHVPEKNVSKIQYSYIIIKEDVNNESDRAV